GSMMQVVAAVLNGSPAPLESHRRDIPQAVRDVVMKSLARKSADRYQTYDEFRAAVASLRKPETAPATIWDRFRAAVVDSLIVSAISSGFFHLTISLLNKNWATTSTQGLELNTVLVSILAVLIVGVPEGLYGMSVGKWMLGIRVINLQGGLPGLARGVARSALLQLFEVAWLIAQLTGVNKGTRATLSFFVSGLARLVVLVTVRRGNGVMMVHDWITGTRVVKRSVGAQKRHADAARREAPVLTGSERRIGPYAVVGPLSADSSVLLGWDASMHRAVWIVPQPDGAPENSQARRDLARLTRLRWVAGRRARGENWDAYESPFGEPLASRLQRPVPWSVQQNWMLDLTAELSAALADGTMPAALTVDALWVTAGDRIVIPESAGDVTVQADSAGALAFIGAVRDRVRAAASGGAPLPRYATEAMNASGSAKSVDDVNALFKATLGRPVTISRARRGGLIAATLGVVFFIPIVSALPLRSASQHDPQGQKLSGLLQFIGDSVHAVPDSLRPKTQAKKSGLFTDFNTALKKAGWMPLDTALDRLSPEEYQRESRLAQIYVATQLSARVHDTLGAPGSTNRGASVTLYGKSPPENRLAFAILKKYSDVDSADVRDARMLVDSTWHGSPPGTNVDLMIRVVGAVLFIFLPWFIAVCAIVIAVLARRGALMRGFSIDIVTKTGEPAGRLRILVRNLVSWSPLLAPIAICYAVLLVPQSAAALVFYAILGVIASAFVAGIWMAVTTTERGIADRVAGTYLVPE
ncbi:MAG TPA: RDD family protein, partial [Gemmatimonadaceae bacterium]|nr:RDD family protein [Gemmatimonadaceae bacterium]